MAVVRSPVRTLSPHEYGGALVVWPGMLFPNLDGRIHQSLVFFIYEHPSHVLFVFEILDLELNLSKFKVYFYLSHDVTV